MAVTGWPVGTFVRGRSVMWEGSSPRRPKASACAFWKLWRARDSKLLPLLDREFTVANAVARDLGEFGGRFFTICETNSARAVNRQACARQSPSIPS